MMQSERLLAAFLAFIALSANWKYALDIQDSNLAIFVKKSTFLCVREGRRTIDDLHTNVQFNLQNFCRMLRANFNLQTSP